MYNIIINLKIKQNKVDMSTIEIINKPTISVDREKDPKEERLLKSGALWGMDKPHVDTQVAVQTPKIKTSLDDSTSTSTSTSTSPGTLSSGRAKVLIVQNYAGTGGTEGVSLQLVQNATGRIQYSFMEILCGSLRNIGKASPGGRAMERMQEVISTDPITGKVTREKEMVKFNFDLSGRISSSGRFERGSPRLDTQGVDLRTGKIGEQIRNTILEQGGTYENLELAPRSATLSDGSKSVGILSSESPLVLHKASKARLMRSIQKERPDVIYVAQDHAARAIVEVAGELGIPVVYGIHREDLSLTAGGAEKIACVAYNAKASKEGRFASVIGCSPSVQDNFRSIGGDDRSFRVVINGIDSKKYARNNETGTAFRIANKIPPTAKVVTIAGRYSPEKDFYTFVRTAVQALKEKPELHFVMCGNQVTPENMELFPFLQRELEKEGLANRISQFHLLGFQDMPAVFSASNVVMSTSSTESWGLTLLEGAAAGNIIVHSDVPGMSHAMKETTEGRFRVVRENSTETYQGQPLLTPHCITQFKDVLLDAVRASDDECLKQKFIARAKECDIQTTVEGYESAFLDSLSPRHSSSPSLSDDDSPGSRPSTPSPSQVDSVHSDSPTPSSPLSSPTLSGDDNSGSRPSTPSQTEVEDVQSHSVNSVPLSTSKTSGKPKNNS